MQLSIIIVNYNVKYFLEHCLLSVVKACKNIDAEILVVDNNSTDGSKAYLSPKFPMVQFFWNIDNPGFGKANNSVLDKTKGDYVLFLNPDTIVPEDCFTNCIAFFEKNTDCGALGVRMIDGAGNFLKESKRSLPSATAGFYKMTGLADLFPTSKIFASYYAGHVAESANAKVDVLAGAFMMLSKKAIDITQGFDESFFMYGEDIDLSYRIQKAGLNNYYVGDTTIIHFKGESTKKLSPNYVTHFYGAMNRFVNKHYSNNSIKQSLMNVVIEIGKNFARLKQFFAKETRASSFTKPKQCLFIGNGTKLQKVNEIIQASVFEIKAQTSNVENSLSIISEKNIDTVIFCEEAISNKSIITILEKLPKHILALFYQNGATSIIGSNDKNQRGIFIAKP
jgi:GT2 family glycosyltransferase